MKLMMEIPSLKKGYLLMECPRLESGVLSFVMVLLFFWLLVGFVDGFCLDVDNGGFVLWFGLCEWGLFGVGRWSILIPLILYEIGRVIWRWLALGWATLIHHTLTCSWSIGSLVHDVEVNAIWIHWSWCWGIK